MPLLRFDVTLTFADGPDWVCEDVEARNEAEAVRDCMEWARDADLHPSGSSVRLHNPGPGKPFTMLDLDRALGLR